MQKTFLILTLCLLQLTTSAEPPKFSGMIQSHNQVRAKHNLAPLRWSNELAGYAQQWANELAHNRSCTMQHRPNFGVFKQQFGENLFWASPERWSNGIVKLQSFSARDIVEAWAEEENYYDYHRNHCQTGQDCGHYTQIVWHESRKVGCAIAICDDKSQIWACNYDPPGNFIGERPF